MTNKTLKVGEIKDGDVFRWHWNESEIERREESRQSGTLYWCVSQICIAQEEDGGITLYDTYWYGRSKRVCPEKVELQFLGNLNDFEEVHESEGNYYSDDDIIDLRHPNCGGRNFYIRKGAVKDKDKIRSVIRRKVDRAEQEAKSAKCNADRYRSMLGLVDTDIDSIFL